MAGLFAGALIAPHQLDAQTIEARPAGDLTVSTLPRIEGSALRIDGRVDEAEWLALPVLPVSQKVPVEGAPPSQLTEIRIAYDDQYLYLSGRLFDEEPDRIVANTKKRDDFHENTGWIGLLIDTFDDRENALGFWVTPTGSRLDMAISNDAQGPLGISTDWNAHWDGATTRDADGWYAEIRIPFSVLPFTQVGERTTMGITTWRYIARTDETVIFPPRGLSSGSSFRPSLMHRFELTGVRSSPSLTISPFSLVGRSSALDPTAATPLRHVDYDREVGLDVRFTSSGNLSVDVTANTDFAQVEVDGRQVNLSRAALFFPEKRIFFQERASLFDFAFGAVDRAFYSRQIGIVDGQRTGIYGGLRAVGKFRGWEGGFLSMQTERLGANPSENVSVLRVRRPVFSEGSTVGGIATRRAASSGSSNLLIGGDATLGLFGSSFLTVRAAITDDTEANEGSTWGRARLFADLSKRSQEGLTYGVSLHHSGESYDPALGFASRANIRAIDANVGYNIFPTAESPWVQYGPTLSASRTSSASTGIFESRSVRLGFQLFSKSGWGANAQASAEVEQLEAMLPLGGGVTIPDGRHAFRSVTATATTPSSYRLAGTISGTTGGFFDRHRTSILFAPIVTVTPDVLFTGSYQVDWIGASSLQDPVTVHLTSAKLDVYVSTQLSLSTLLQYDSTQKLYVGSARLRFNPSEGNDLYIVWNADANADRSRRMPALPLSNRNTIQIKYTHAFRPSL